jgi:hypothetical protein
MAPCLRQWDVCRMWDEPGRVSLQHFFTEPLIEHWDAILLGSTVDEGCWVLLDLLLPTRDSDY